MRHHPQDAPRLVGDTGDISLRSVRIGRIRDLALLIAVAQHHASLFLQRVESRAHCKPFIYTSRAYWNERMDDTFGEYPLWLANYSNHVPDPPKGWTRVAMWQYADKMNLPGFGEVDVNVFNGTLAELRKGGVPKK